MPTIAERSQKTQEEQASRVCQFKPAKPEIATDGRCADAACEAQMPPHPPGTLNESFRSRSRNSSRWLATLGAAALLFTLLTVFSRSRSRS